MISRITLIKLALPALVLFGSSEGYAQGRVGDLRGSGSSADTSTVDTTTTGGDAGGWGASTEETPAVQVKPKVPYKRFIPPFDTSREIIYYSGVIEDEKCETCGADSLYWRTLKYLTKKFGKENMKDKKWVLENVVGNKIVLKVTTPMLIQGNAYNKMQSGYLEYRIAIRFQEGRFKYQFGNFVHIQVERGSEAKTIRTYHEYYMRVKKGYQNTDPFLLAADRDVKDIVEGLTKALKGPYQPDEDDW